MAYLTEEDKKKDEAQSPGLLGGYLSQPGAKSAQTPWEPGGEQASASGTGHVNFDRIYAANEATANRGANQYAGAARGAANQARSSLTGLQDKFVSQSKAPARRSSRRIGPRPERPASERPTPSPARAARRQSSTTGRLRARLVTTRPDTG